MIRSGPIASKKSRLTALVATAATAVLLFEGIASAQVRVSSLAAPGRSADLAGVESPGDTAQREHRARQPIRDSLSRIDYGSPARQTVPGASTQSAASGSWRSVTRKVLGGAIGATGGFFGGGYLGATIEGDRCYCDDPGLKGALIGAPVGAVIGGILGAMFF